MAESDEFKINLKISGRAYPVFCKRSEEGLFREAARVVNDRINRYQSMFENANLDRESILAMAAIHLSTYKLKLERKKEVSSVFETLEKLTEKIDNYLETNG
jgi:cell division protein ZapA